MGEGKKGTLEIRFPISTKKTTEDSWLVVAGRGLGSKKEKKEGAQSSGLPGGPFPAEYGRWGL